jgi:serine/threonine protein kinase
MESDDDESEVKNLEKEDLEVINEKKKKKYNIIKTLIKTPNDKEIKKVVKNIDNKRKNISEDENSEDEKKNKRKKKNNVTVEKVDNSFYEIIKKYQETIKTEKISECEIYKEMSQIIENNDYYDNFLNKILNNQKDREYFKIILCIFKFKLVNINYLELLNKVNLDNYLGNLEYTFNPNNESDIDLFFLNNLNFYKKINKLIVLETKNSIMKSNRTKLSIYYCIHDFAFFYKDILIWYQEDKFTKDLNFFVQRDLYKLFYHTKEQNQRIFKQYGEYLQENVLNNFASYGCFCSYNKVYIIKIKLSCTTENLKERYPGYEFSIIDQFKIDSIQNLEKYISYFILCVENSINAIDLFEKKMMNSDTSTGKIDLKQTPDPKRQVKNIVINKIKYNKTEFNDNVFESNDNVLKKINDNELLILKKIHEKKNFCENIVYGSFVTKKFKETIEIDENKTKDITQKNENFFLMEKFDKFELDKIKSIKLQTMKNVMNGINFLHINGIVHNDIKLTNLVLHLNTAKIIDFGISFLTKDLSVYNLRDYSYPSGTGYYRAPEKFLKSEINTNSINEKCDIYSAGIVLCEIAMGMEFRDIFKYNGIKSTFDYKTKIPNFLKGIFNSKKLEYLIFKMIENDPKKRISAIEVLNMLNDMNNDDFKIYFFKFFLKIVIF